MEEAAENGRLGRGAGGGMADAGAVGSATADNTARQ